MIDGLTAGNLSIAQAYISDVTKPEERAKSFAVIGIAFGLGFLIGPAISGFLAQYGIRYPIFAAASLSATSIACTWFLLPRGTPIHTGTTRLALLDWGTYVRFWRQPGLGSLLWQFLVFIFSFSAFFSGFALFAERRFTWQGHPFGPREVGYVYAYVGVLAILLQGGLIGRLVKKYGEWKLVQIGFVVSTIGYVALGFTYSIPMLLLVAALTSAGSGILRPTITSLVTQSAARSEQGAVLGLTQSLMSIAQIVAPLIGGMLIDHQMFLAWVLIPAAANAIGLFFQRPAVVAATSNS
jgi:MFS family permease